jgi:hypothetical protein
MTVDFEFFPSNLIARLNMKPRKEEKKMIKTLKRNDIFKEPSSRSFSKGRYRTDDTLLLGQFAKRQLDKKGAWACSENPF